MMHKIFTVDAFSESTFGGNPAAIMPLDKVIPDDLMQNIAAEINLSETSFVTKEGEGSWKTSKKFGLRWMTPTNEVNLCGHATLATAHVIFNEYGNINEILQFETLSGSLFIRKEGKEIIMDFPVSPSVPLTSSQIEVCFVLSKEVLGDLEAKEITISNRPFKNLLIRLDDSYTRKDFESIQPDIKNLSRLHDGSTVEGIIVTLKGELQDQTTSAVRGLEKYHFISRYFAPWNGIDEDPVTGSAHCTLGPYWVEKLGITELTCHQCSTRGGDLKLILSNDNRISIRGRATTVIEGTFTHNYEP